MSMIEGCFGLVCICQSYAKFVSRIYSGFSILFGWLDTISRRVFYQACEDESLRNLDLIGFLSLFGGLSFV